MKTTAFFALAITAVLLGFWQDSPRPHDRAAGHGDGAPAPQMQVTHAAPVAGGTLAAQAPPLPAPITTSGPPAPTAPAGGPAAGPPLQTASTPAPATADAGSAPDWRDDALDLLSQIGLLCPTAGCDSLEDD